jgi:hypothetical protein
VKSELDYPLSMVGPNTSFFGSFQLFQNSTRCPSPIPFLSQAGKRALSIDKDFHCFPIIYIIHYLIQNLLSLF